MTIGTGTTGLIFDSGQIYPWNTTTNAAIDASKDLGASGARFKDLYLSGNAYANTYRHDGDSDTYLNFPAANQLSLVGGGATIVKAYKIAGAYGVLEMHGSGSATYPNFTFNGDSNTGMYRANTDTLAFTTGGTERMRINASGDILGKTADVRIGSDVGAVEYGTSTGNSVRFYSNDTERVRIDSSGKVGIGDSTPTARLDIGGMAAGEVGLQITSPRNDALSTGLAYINITDSVAPFSALTINHSGTGKSIELRDSGNVAGFISTVSNDMFLGTDNTGIRFVNASGAITPIDPSANGNARDNAISLGTSSVRFKEGRFVTLYGDGSNLTGVGGSTAYGAVGTYVIGYGSNNVGYSTGDTIAGSAIGYDDGGSFDGGGLSKFLYSGGSSSSGSVAFGYYGYWSSLGLSGTWRAMTEGGAAAVGRIQAHLWVRVS
jgi:hypothetical protein